MISYPLPNICVYLGRTIEPEDRASIIAVCHSILHPSVRFDMEYRPWGVELLIHERTMSDEVQMLLDSLQGVLANSVLMFTPGESQIWRRGPVQIAATNTKVEACLAVTEIAKEVAKASQQSINTFTSFAADLK